MSNGLRKFRRDHALRSQEPRRAAYRQAVRQIAQQTLARRRAWQQVAKDGTPPREDEGAAGPAA